MQTIVTTTYNLPEDDRIFDTHRQADAVIGEITDVCNDIRSYLKYGDETLDASNKLLASVYTRLMGVRGD